MIYLFQYLLLYFCTQCYCISGEVFIYLYEKTSDCVSSCCELPRLITDWGMGEGLNHTAKKKKNSLFLNVTQGLGRALVKTK